MIKITLGQGLMGDFKGWAWGQFWFIDLPSVKRGASLITRYSVIILFYSKHSFCVVFIYRISMIPPQTNCGLFFGVEHQPY